MDKFKIGDKVILNNTGMPYHGTEGEIIDHIESMGTYNVRTRWGDFWRYDFELKEKGSNNEARRD